MRWAIPQASISRWNRRTIGKEPMLCCPIFLNAFRRSWETSVRCAGARARFVQKRQAFRASFRQRTTGKSNVSMMYKARHLIENCFARLKPFRGIATRYDNHAKTFLGAVHLAASVIWLNWRRALLCHQATAIQGIDRTGRRQIALPHAFYFLRFPPKHQPVAVVVQTESRHPSILFSILSRSLDPARLA